MQAEEQPGGVTSGSASALLTRRGLATGTVLSVLVNGRGPPANTFCTQCDSSAVADGDDVAVVGVEDVQRRSIPLARLASDVLEGALQRRPSAEPTARADW